MNAFHDKVISHLDKIDAILDEIRTSLNKVEGLNGSEHLFDALDREAERLMDALSS